ncbi:glycine betaine/L-proline ABC transporter substrate-binding protein ProX [Mesorhizobium sp. Cs1299R1N3]|uniref:glycine betaine/L-proline ABC transporter substrate-binding protein ProX n=1 Tax=Mesorhizobium sp. Cs1299R1N3 TaxID=3015173 RepID=UPI00301DE055
MFKRTIVAATVLALTAGTAFASGCEVGAGKKIRPMQPSSLAEIFFHDITFRALEKLGYEVAQPEEAEYATIHIAVANGDVDFTASHWNVLHKPLYDEAGGAKKMTIVGRLISDAVQGYLVDKKSYDAGVKNLEEFKKPEVAAKFDSDGDGKADLAGCAPGWGCEKVIERHLDKLGLRDTVTHNQGAYDAMMADVIARYKSGHPIVFFTWTPYWVTGVLVPGKDVEWIAVPKIEGDEALYTDFEGKNLGFGIDYASFLVNNEFLKANPAVKTLFENVSINVNDVSAEASRQQQGESKIDQIKQHADEWIAQHQSAFDGWVDKACAAK